MGTVDLFDEDIEQLHDDLSAEPWLQLSVDDVRNSSQLPIRISYEYADMRLTKYGFDQNFTQRFILVLRNMQTGIKQAYRKWWKIF